METPASRPLIRAILVAVACALAVTLTACGEDGADRASDDASAASSSGGSGAASSPTTAASATATSTKKGPNTSSWLACDRVWIAGKRLPEGYRGCVDGAKPVRAKPEWCESGQVLVTYAGRFYAVLGGPVNETAGLNKSAGYKTAVDSCFA